MTLDLHGYFNAFIGTQIRKLVQDFGIEAHDTREQNLNRWVFNDAPLKPVLSLTMHRFIALWPTLVRNHSLLV